VRLSGRIAIVTGVENVLAAAVARRFVAEGARVVLVDTDHAAAGRLLAQPGLRGDTALAVSADLMTDAGWLEALSVCVDTFGPVDLLFNGVQAFRSASIAEMDAAEFGDLFDQVAVSAWLGQKHVIGAMRAGGQRGSIINLVSALAQLGVPDCAVLAAAARGVLMSTKSAALECARDGAGIVVNALLVGRVDGDPLHFPGALVLPDARPVDPERVAAAALYLATDGAAYMTGAELAVDAGLSGLR
jgi:NAD(P)-dependent dehydrogenase (short-subunit alcohol dehydrogenase family)